MAEERKSYSEWTNEFNGLSDVDAARKVKQMIIDKGELDAESVRLFNDMFDYMVGNIEKGVDTDMTSVESYIKERGYDTSKVNITVIFILLSFCGITIGNKK